MFELQSPLQSWLPASHWPEHAAAASMQAPAHSFLPVGQEPPHMPFVHVADPPVGTEQGVHDIPHVATSVSRTHVPLHRW